ncbi:MAG TPA: pitrilysin family protein [Candidatus Cybelea sp.]|nr:pitrilysin family protein [Candidatus Cybelea sp.]
MAVQVTRLDNGLRVVTERMAELKTASVGVWVDAGARFETPDVHGVAHLLEHMAFKGTARRNARQIAEEIEAVGGHLNAYTSREQTAYYARVLSEDVPLAVDILSDILQHSIFADDELERERQVVIQEIGQANDTPDDIIFDYLQERAFPDQALGRPILGTLHSVAGMSRDQLAGFMRHHYHAPRLVVAGAGGVEHEHLVDLAGKAFGALGNGEVTMAEPARYAGGEKREARDLEQVHVALAFQGIPYKDPDFHAAQVYATLLGGGMSSRLFQEVRESRGLAYSIFAFTASYNDTGLFTVYAGTGEDQLPEFTPVVAEEIQKTTKSVGDEEVARARAQLKAGLLMSLESSSARAEQLGRQMILYGRPLPTEEIVAQVDAVDAAAVCRVAKRIVGGGRPTVAALGPLDRLESYDRLAARFG